MLCSGERRYAKIHGAPHLEIELLGAKVIWLPVCWGCIAGHFWAWLFCVAGWVGTRSLFASIAVR